MTDDQITPPPPPTPPNPGTPRPASRGGFEPMEGGLEIPNLLNKLLRRPLSVIHNLENSEEGRRIPARLLVIAVSCLAIFGFVVGTFAGHHQLWAAPLKIIGGLLFSGLICLPSLYIFACLGGLAARFRTIAGLLTGFLALSALLLVGFAPVVWLFSVSSTSVAFLGFLLLTLWIVCAGFGLVLVFRAGQALGMTNTAHLVVWGGVFLLVTLQMTTTLRPIVGPPGPDQSFLNVDEKKFFLSYWSEQLGKDLDRRPVPDVSDE